MYAYTVTSLTRSGNMTVTLFGRDYVIIAFVFTFSVKLNDNLTRPHSAPLNTHAGSRMVNMKEVCNEKVFTRFTDSMGTH